MRTPHFLLIATVAALSASVVMADDNLDEAKAVKKIELLGGRVTRDPSLPGRPVVGVSLFGSERFNDKYLYLLRQFASLKTLSLFAVPITDEGLKEIGTFENLSRLNLDRTQVTDKGLKELSKLKQLKILSLNATEITDDGLSELGQLTNLTTLNLIDTAITDEGLRQLSKLNHLERLRVDRTKVTDKGLQEISRFKSLKMLHLSGSQTTEEAEQDLEDSRQNLVIINERDNRSRGAPRVRPVVDPRPDFLPAGRQKNTPCDWPSPDAHPKG